MAYMIWWCLMAYRIRSLLPKPMAMSSNPAIGKHFSFCILACFAVFATRVSPCKWNLPRPTSGQYPLLDLGSLERTRRWPVQARVAATEFLLFVYLRATYMLVFLCCIPLNPYFTELYTSIPLFIWLKPPPPLFLQSHVIPVLLET